MAAPDAATIEKTLKRHVELWNASEKSAWLEAWRNVVSGDIQMEDPVGTPVKHGWDPMSEAFDRSAESWKLSIEKLYVCGSTAAAVVRNEGTVQGNSVVLESIETYKFGDDGSLRVEVYYDIADADPDYAEWTSTTGTT